jgi:hypothetical protein
MKPQEAFEYLGFKRTTRFNKERLSLKLRKDWLSKDKKYHIYWRRQSNGVNVPSRYYALRHEYIDHPDGGWFMWNFAWEHRPYKTLKEAVVACMRAENIEVEEKVKQRKRRKRKVTKMTDEINQQIPVAETPDAPKRRGRPPGSKNQKPRVDKGQKRGPRSKK